jgi:hypothetical protein
MDIIKAMIGGINIQQARAHITIPSQAGGKSFSLLKRMKKFLADLKTRSVVQKHGK